MISEADIYLPSLQILGVRVHMIQMARALAIAECWIQQRDQCHYVVATGMHGVMEANRDRNFKEILNEADLLVPDGISLVWTARLRGIHLKGRVCGPDLMLELCEVAERKGYRVFFYGDTRETLELLEVKLLDRFPKLLIAGSHSPPFQPLTPDEEEQEITMINDAEPDVVWVGLGLPKQENWMHRNKGRLSAPLIVGVGAAFKFHSGSVKRAPIWVGTHGGEWLWRFFQEPRRIWRRVFFDAPLFAVHVMLEVSGLRKYRE